MKVIFLDIDGVLNSNPWNSNPGNYDSQNSNLWAPGFPDCAHQAKTGGDSLLDVEKIRLLGVLVRETNAKIILHSGWRFWFDAGLNPLRKEAENLRDLLEQEGLQIDGITPDYTTEEIRKSRKFSLVKASEILGWVREHKEIESWIVIDDLDLHHPEIEARQLRTDPAAGLTIEDVYRAEAMLQKAVP